MGGYTVSSQTFAVVTQASDNLLTYPYSGLMGLAWQSLSTSGALPFWEALASSNAWSTPSMTFFLERYRDDQYATQVESNGGLFTLGYLNSSLYTGSVNYVSIPTSNQDYWRIPVSGATIQGSSVSIVSKLSMHLFILFNLAVSSFLHDCDTDSIHACPSCSFFTVHVKWQLPLRSHRFWNHPHRSPIFGSFSLLRKNIWLFSSHWGICRILRISLFDHDFVQFAVRGREL